MVRKVKHTLVLSVIALLLAGCGADSNMKKGDKYFALGEYFDAADQYKTAYAKTPPKERKTRGERAFKMAVCYQKINYTQRALGAYLNALRYKHDDVSTHLSLGQMYLGAGNYKDAAKQFQIVEDSDANNELAKIGMQSATMATIWKKKESLYTVKRMNLFNSRRADYSPMLSGDEYDQLFFTSTRNQAQGDELSGITGTKNGDIFFSQKDEKGNWGKPQTIESELNSEFDEGACCCTPDSKEMYLTQCKTDPQYPRYATICTSKRSDASWSKCTPVDISKDTLSSYAHPAISPDGEWLYFTSDMPGGLGGLDLWRIRLTTNGLGGVENLGEPINTPGDEEFPTFRPNGDLYFSSNGHPGMGGLDILIATADTITVKWAIEHP